MKHKLSSTDNTLLSGCGGSYKELCCLTSYRYTGDEKAGDSLGCSDREIVESSVEKRGRRTGNKTGHGLQPLIPSQNFCLFRDLLGRIPGIRPRREKGSR